MQISDWLVDSMVALKKAGVDAPRTDCLVFLCDALAQDKSWILAHPEEELVKGQLEKLNIWLNRRKRREPLAYIRGRVEFYGRDFTLNKHVLIPRPESEDFITLLQELKPIKVIDVGTGSGCLAITAALELPLADIYAIDNDPAALDVARRNTKVHGVQIEFILGEFLDPWIEDDLSKTTIIANLPYVPRDLVTSPEITKEPAQAIFSGEDGLDHYRFLWKQIKSLGQKPGFILTESLENQHAAMIKMAQGAGYEFVKQEGLIQLFKK